MKDFDQVMTQITSALLADRGFAPSSQYEREEIAKQAYLMAAEIVCNSILERRTVLEDWFDTPSGETWKYPVLAERLKIAAALPMPVKRGFLRAKGHVRGALFKLEALAKQCGEVGEAALYQAAVEELRKAEAVLDGWRHTVPSEDVQEEQKQP